MDMKYNVVTTEVEVEGVRGINGDGLRMSMTCCLFKDCYSESAIIH